MCSVNSPFILPVERDIWTVNTVNCFSELIDMFVDEGSHAFAVIFEG